MKAVKKTSYFFYRFYNAKVIESTILVVLSMLFFYSVDAQSHKFEGGIIINHNISQFTGGSALLILGSKNYFAPGAGIFVQRGFSKYFYSTFEVRYTQKGNAFRNAHDGDIGVRLHYIETPLMLGYNFKVKKRKFYIEVGPAVGHLLSSDIHFGNIYKYRPALRVGVDDFKENELSLVISLKSHLTKKRNLLLGLRYSTSDLFYSVHNKYFHSNVVYGIELNYLIK